MRMQHHSVGFSVHPVAVCVITYDWMTEAQTMQSQLVTSPCGQKKNGTILDGRCKEYSDKYSANN